MSSLIDANEMKDFTDANYIKTFIFADNTKQYKIGYKIRPIIDHLNESFQAAFSNESGQLIY